MAFMQPEYVNGQWLSITTDFDEVLQVPADLGLDPSDCIESGEVAEVETIEGWGARLSAPGYLDCTDWAVFDTLAEARTYLEETWEVDPDTGDSLEDSDDAEE